MCNKGVGFLRSSQSESTLDQNQAVYVMDTPAPVMSTTKTMIDETPRVKFLCSFAGSILPRPLDGKLRYVGGETRIVSLPRGVNYEELMLRMRELFEGASLLKYQQPDEDLDALVSVVNDDDVTNMMEEYDKLGSGDGFTRLRIFLFSHPDHDASHFDTDERETERRYVDALNSLADGPELRKQQSEVPVEQFFNHANLDISLHNQRNCEVPLPQFSLHHLKIPHQPSGQHPQPHAQHYNEMETPWSPAYYSPAHHGLQDPRAVPEFPSSPSSGRYRIPFGDLHDKCLERMHEEYGRQAGNHQLPYDHQPPFVDSVVWLPPGAIPGDKAGFPGNLGHSHSVFEGNSICEHCRMTFQRSQAVPEARYPDHRWKHGQPHLEQSGAMGNEFAQYNNACADCFHGREAYMMIPDPKLDLGIYPREPNEQRPFYNESHNHERGWALHHQLNHRAEEPRRVNEQYMVDGSGMNIPYTHGNCCDGHPLSSNFTNQDDPRYIRPGSELGNEGFHDQTVGAGPHAHIPAHEDCGIRCGSFQPTYGTDNPHQLSHGSSSIHALRRKVQNPMQGGPSYEPSGFLPQGNSVFLPQGNGVVNTGLPRGTQEGSPRFSRLGMDDQNPSQKIFGFDGSAAPEYHHDHAPQLNANIHGLENQKNPFTQESVQCQSAEAEVVVPPSLTLVDDKIVATTTLGSHLISVSSSNITAAVKLGENMVGEAYEVKLIGTAKEPDVLNFPSQKENQEVGFDSNGFRLNAEGGDTAKIGDFDTCTLGHGELSVQYLSFLPELLASAKRAALVGAEEVKARAHENVDVAESSNSNLKEASLHELEPVNPHVELEADSDSDQPDNSKIEPTKAEEEALARGLQTIKNDDLEEIRELGSGTYGAVFHGKWKGSDVAIKRIKASCFAGRPSERERLIADFWKEALILSSLHHPNVVSFYGIVRDGPDGTLATVTEFMINGSLKQVLQKKDRTIDRRKRLIIAMDAAFGMEYLHGKNIVHFDLKCENLLVNMRDPHRPVCKIGDLGLSKVKQHTLVSGGVRGTLPWMAPELLSGKTNMVTEKIDVYSFGIVMWELLTGEEPYADMHCASIIGGIVNNTLRPQVPTWCDPEWKALMEGCWAPDPGERPSFSEISQKLRKMSAAINVK
eukprot:TRINITY_DN1129_c0_g1_i1.p1 TRINITY_DN1129_c0_g1~~TRINITY_DN1129_c0_g1_i1.p1  ORF type:complete len:1137 (-),score=223.70 TRINITY_DN1129_c0_g1_i1:510-3920(-)